MCGPTQTLLLQSQKMLASTVQFSTYNQTPTPLHRQTRAPTGTTAVRQRIGPDQRRNDPTRKTPDGPLSQDPTACLRTGPTTNTPFHAPPVVTPY
jgi:hypothetical protein